jgi:hypothetical protein
MGGGVSSADGNTQFTEEDLKQMCRAYSHDQFIFETVYQSDLLFIALQDPIHEMISLEEWTTLIEDSAEQESLRLYLKYCPNGEMTQNQFLQFNINLKFLSKHHYTKKAAQSFFLQYSYFPITSSSPSPIPFNKDQDDKDKLINYSILRFKIFPHMVQIKHISITDLILRLSRIESTDLIISEISSTPTSSYTSDLRDNDWKNKKIFAALQIQKIHRYRSAKLEINKLKKLREIELQATVSSSSATATVTAAVSSCSSALVPPPDIQKTENPIISKDLEMKCLDIFQRYSGFNHEMNIHEYLKLCHETTVIPYDGVKKIDLTTREAKYIFQCCVAGYFDPMTNTYRHGVIHGKRILYEVYRNVVLPALAEWKKISLEEILGLVSCVGTMQDARRVYARETGGPQIISLLSASHHADEVWRPTPRGELK